MPPELRNDSHPGSGCCPRAHAPKHHGRRSLLSRSEQSGFGLVAAMFLIIVIGGVIAAMWRMSLTQAATSDFALQQARAYQAARAGLEWGIWQFLNDECTASSFNIPGLDGFQVTVECPEALRTEHTDLHEEPSPDMISQTIIATATYAAVGSPDYAYRRLSVVVEKAQPLADAPVLE